MPRNTPRILWRFLLASSLPVLVAEMRPAHADDSGFLGRLFRFGGSSASGTNPSNQPSPLPYGHESDSGSGSAFVPPATPSSTPPSASSLPTFGGGSAEGPSTPSIASPTGATPRLTPQPRASSALTSADPLLTRFALGRSNDGNQFGMFLQIFADGTVIDSEGVHHLRPIELKPIFDVVQSGEMYRLRGHCGAPATDFVEYVHLVVYERRLGRLNAHSFSYSGNPQGCDHVIRHLHLALENLQAKLSRQPVTTSSGISSAPAPVGGSSLLAAPSPTGTPFNPVPGTTASMSRQPGQPGTSPYPRAPSNSVIPLTPINPTR